MSRKSIDARDIESLEKQLESLQENLRILLEKESQYVNDNDIPAQVKKDISVNRRKIKSIEKQLSAFQENISSAKDLVKDPEVLPKQNAEQEVIIVPVSDDSSPISNSLIPAIQVDQQNDFRDFINRRDERRDLERLNGRPYIQIYGPAGYGKTYLMKKIRQRYLDEYKWETIWINFRDKKDLQDSAWQVAAETLKQYGCQISHEETIDDLTARICGEVARRNNKVIFFFESIDRAEIKVLEFLEDNLIPDLNSSSRIQKVRAIFETRYPIIRDHPSQFPLQPFPLSNFSEDAVQEMLDYFLERDKVALDPDDEEKIVKSILDLSMGHPKCVKKIIDLLSPHYARPIEHYRFKDRKLFFYRSIKPIIEAEILSEVTKESLSIFQTLCTFRLLSPVFIHCFSNMGHLPNKDFSSTLMRLDFIKKFEDIAWLGLNKDEDILYKIDPVIRHVLSVDSQFTDEIKIRELHEHALSIYKNMMSGKSELGEAIVDRVSPNEQVTYLVEAMYHQCKLLEVNHQRDNNDCMKLLQDLLIEGIKGITPKHEMPISTYLDRLRLKMEQDLDLKPLITFLAGGKHGFSDLIKAIE